MKHCFKEQIDERIKNSIRKSLVRFMEWLGLWGTLYANGSYLYLDKSTVFPVKNLFMLKIADKMDLHDAFFNIWDEIIIEKGVVFGHQVMFLTGKHEVGQGGVDKKAATGGKIVVKENAWIGSRATILGGVFIGKGSVVGAGSVVTKSIPDHEFWAGNPAHFIKHIG